MEYTKDIIFLILGTLIAYGLDEYREKSKYVYIASYCDENCEYFLFEERNGFGKKRFYKRSIKGGEKVIISQEEFDGFNNKVTRVI